MTIEDQERQQLVEQMLDATTIEEIQAVKTAAREWLKKHPNDWTIESGFEQLYMMEDAVTHLKEAEAGKGEDASEKRKSA